MFKDIRFNIALGNTKVLGNVWKYVWLVTPMKPLWNGFMKLSHDGPRQSTTAIHFEPMIDMPSSDYSCFYSTMSFLSVLSRTYIIDPVLTSNQPLHWKAMKITT